MRIDKNTKLFISIASTPGNIGAKFYNNLFKKKKINAIYLPIKIDKLFENISQTIKLLNISGCSVSMPHKSAVIKYLDFVEKKAKIINSVNTIVNKNKKLYGYNTDSYSVRKLIKKSKINSKSKILIIGSGSMCKTFYQELYKKFPNTYITNRKNTKVLNISRNKIIDWSTKKNYEFDIIINTTPLGMINHSGFPLDKFNFKNCKIVIDVVAIPKKTNLNIFSTKNKIKFIPGSVLVQFQAEKQFELYTHKKL